MPARAAARRTWSSASGLDREVIHIRRRMRQSLRCARQHPVESDLSDRSRSKDRWRRRSPSTCSITAGASNLARLAVGGSNCVQSGGDQPVVMNYVGIGGRHHGTGGKEVVMHRAHASASSVRPSWPIVGSVPGASGHQLLANAAIKDRDHGSIQQDRGADIP